MTDDGLGGDIFELRPANLEKLLIKWPKNERKMAAVIFSIWPDDRDFGYLHLDVSQIVKLWTKLNP